MRATPFSFKASRMAGVVEPDPHSYRDVRPDLSRTEMWCFGLAGWKYMKVIKLLLNLRFKSA